MGVKKWGPLFALLALTAVSVAGLVVQDTKPNDRAEPSKSENRNSPNPKSVAEVATDQSHKEREKEKSWYEPFLEKPTDTLLVMFNGLLALYTWQLYKATRGLVDAAAEQAKDMKNSIKAATDAVENGIGANQISVTNAERQLRAYVTATTLSLTPHRDPSYVSTTIPALVDGRINTYRFEAILRNGGQTPAINVIINASCERVRSVDLTNFAFRDSTRFGHGVIGPVNEIHSPSIPIAAHVFEPVDDTEWVLWGWVEYDDVFSGTPRHRTEFAFQIIRVRPPNSTELWVSFQPLDRFNAVDGGCMRPFWPHENVYSDRQPGT